MEAHPVPVASDFKVLIGILKNGLSTFFIFFFSGTPTCIDVGKLFAT